MGVVQWMCGVYQTDALSSVELREKFRNEFVLVAAG